MWEGLWVCCPECGRKQFSFFGPPMAVRVEIRCTCKAFLSTDGYEVKIIEQPTRLPTGPEPAEAGALSTERRAHASAN